jgi:hypothetical protein
MRDLQNPLSLEEFGHSDFFRLEADKSGLAPIGTARGVAQVFARHQTAAGRRTHDVGAVGVDEAGGESVNVWRQQNLAAAATRSPKPS